MKAAGLNGMPSEACIAMDEDCRIYVCDYINELCHDRSDFESWHKIQCVLLLKSGDLSDPKNWQVVMLIDVMYKIFRCVMNARCFKVLDAHGKQL